MVGEDQEQRESRSIFVGNITPDCSADEIEKLFSEFGQVQDVGESSIAVFNIFLNVNPQISRASSRLCSWTKAVMTPFGRSIAPHSWTNASESSGLEGTAV